MQTRTILYFKLIPLKPSKCLMNGYQYAYNPKHPLANKMGLVYFHRHEASMKIGRWLRNDEDVHHINDNRANNKWNNLAILSVKEHKRLHALGPHRKKKKCPQCKQKYKPLSNKQKYCSQNCSHEAQKRFRITRKKLNKLVWNKPINQIAKILGVSDVAIHKRCRKWNIKKPPHGYWLRNNIMGC